MIVLGIAVAGDAGKTKRPLFVYCVGVVEGGAGGVVIARHQTEMAFLLKLRPFRGHHHQAAGHRLTIQSGRGAFNHVDTLKEPGIDLQRIITAAVSHQTQTVEERIINVAAVEAAQRNRVVACGRAGEVGKDAGAVVQRLVNIHRALIFDLLPRHHRNGLAGGNQRSIGFCRAGAGFGGIARGRRIGGFGWLRGDHQRIGGNNETRYGKRQRAEQRGTFQVERHSHLISLKQSEKAASATARGRKR